MNGGTVTPATVAWYDQSGAALRDAFDARGCDLTDENAIEVALTALALVATPWKEYGEQAGAMAIVRVTEYLTGETL